MVFAISRVSYGCCCGQFNEYTEAEWSVSQDGYQPPANYSLILLSSSTDVSLFGLDLTGGRVVTLRNTGAFSITLVHESTSATSTTMRLDLPQGADLVLEPGHTVTFRRDNLADTTSRVRLLDTTARVEGGTFGGFTVYGGTGPDEVLELSSTDDAAKGVVVIRDGDAFSVGTVAKTETIEGASVTFVTSVRDDGTDPLQGVFRHNATAGTGATMIVGRSRGTEAARTVVVTGDVIASWSFLGFDGTDFSTAAKLVVKATGTIAGNTMPGRIGFQTSPAGSQTPADRLWIESDGGLTLGTDGYFTFDQHGSSPPSPAAGANVVYVDSAGVLTIKDSGGTSKGVGSGAENTLAAAGSTQGDAAPVVAAAALYTAVSVSGADGTKGAILPQQTGLFAVLNTSGVSTLKLYPPSGAKINALATDAPYSILASGVVLFARVSSTRWLATAGA